MISIAVLKTILTAVRSEEKCAYVLTLSPQETHDLVCAGYTVSTELSMFKIEWGNTNEK